jgi:hypothetical protein
MSRRRPLWHDRVEDAVEPDEDDDRDDRDEDDEDEELSDEDAAE